jgi:hypothetical protein
MTLQDYISSLKNPKSQVFMAAGIPVGYIVFRLVALIKMGPAEPATIIALKQFFIILGITSWGCLLLIVAYLLCDMCLYLLKGDIRNSAFNGILLLASGAIIKLIQLTIDGIEKL